ncbi:DUF2970 domain-containing protein [Spiribacter sp. 218]|uniref:DUF2970 domain-containing protein n=1 Tax=Spiribacter pallidus TaxID=1987936 RepID=UPI00349F0D02
MSDKEQTPTAPRLTVWQVIKSTVAAAFGVQTEAARQRDFKQGSAATFIIAGLAFTAAFVVALVVIVNLVLSGAG